MISDLVRSTTGGYVFTGVCLFRWGRGVTPSPSHITSTGPMSLLGVPKWLVAGPFPDPLDQGWGTPPPSQLKMGGTPWWGYPLPRPGMGYPPPPRPGIGQQMEYLIHRGRYASCVHAGGFSCFGNEFAPKNWSKQILPSENLKQMLDWQVYLFLLCQQMPA